jgi:septum formation protein
MHATQSLCLASASPRRKQILAGLGLPFTVCVPDVAEIEDHGEPEGAALRNARMKCAWAQARFPAAHIIAADTVIDFDGRCVGKPATLEEARRMLRAFSACEHTVITASACAAPGGTPGLRADHSVVRFRELSDADIETYVARVDPLDKAGGYDIGQEAQVIIATYTGSLTNIMGLSIEVVREWLQREGLL